ncbi:DNA-directed RNA polymerases I, II, and III subunit RPABC3 [Tulasnella sp. 424]|nr:DNA-directed RNA polymerases I, II, and III subunit RPABC3 [Tulasnella sp. 424]KAG8976435.1 DNA-directed RNA polymerases I, II, and III subunit RPABC3 [Tulasnella sp. 425]
MATRDSNILFDDIFTINGIDTEGKRFDRVSRLSAKSSNFDMTLVLDYNVELYPLYKGDAITVTLASSLSLGGITEDEDANTWRPGAKKTKGLDDDYDYVMYGRVYKFDEAAEGKVTVYVSFGGLLMSLAGSFRHLQNVVIGENIYILMRR